MHRLQPIVRAERERALELYRHIPVGVTLEAVEAKMTPVGVFNEVAACGG
jgi:hypothetical protein